MMWEMQMKRIFIVIWLNLLYMELVYHFSCFGLVVWNPVLFVPVSLIWAGLGTLLVGFMKKKINQILYWMIHAIVYLKFASQVVYIKIFKQPLLFAAIKNAGGMAVKNYWREALDGIIAALPFLLALAVPIFVVLFLMKKQWIVMHACSLKNRIISLGIMSVGFLLFLGCMYIGKRNDWSYVEEYSEFYDPISVVSNYGIIVSIQRDLTGDFFQVDDVYIPVTKEEVPKSSEQTVSENVSGNRVEIENTVSENSNHVEEIEKEQMGDNVLPIDFAKLDSITDHKDVERLNEYIKTVVPTNKNEYTGMFEGYNLIYLTAEGFSTYAVDEELTPTLYKLIHSGFVAENYYVPLWQTSTSDGEYVNLTGLIPDQQFSMKRSAVNKEPFSLASYFKREGADCYAYHNNTLSYYDRHLSHLNLGYVFKASKLGDLDEAEWGDSIFPMENAKAWPSSDLDMMKATVPDYVEKDRFHIYYMTVSGHMNYNFVGNQMSRKNKEVVQNLPYSEEGKAYIACNIELDKALEYLIEELRKHGKLEKTVICLSTDHYPYGMNQDSLNELAGRPLEGTLDIYKNSLILWNSEMETIHIDKACSALDLMPTLLNLFGFPYDSRLFAGRDMLSECEPMVPFADRSFITNKISYYKKTREVTQLTEEVTDEVYLDEMRTEVKNRNKFSSRVLNTDYYRYILQCLPENYEEW